MVFRLPKEAVGRRVKILMQNVAAYELKITSITEDEVIGMWDETDEEHVNQAFIMSWSYITRREMSEEQKKRMVAKRRANKESEDSTKQA